MKTVNAPGDGRTARPGGHRLAPALALVALATMAACMEAPGYAGERTLRPDGDLLATGGAVSVRESVSGDVMTAGRTVDYQGEIGGSFLGAGENVRVGGIVDGSVRAAGRNVRSEAAVGRNVTLAGAEVELLPTADVDGNAYMAGGLVRIAGTVDGAAYAGGERVVIDGHVGGDLRVEAQSLRIGSDATIGGELRYRLAEGVVADIAPSASVAGGTVALEPREDSDGGGIGFSALRVLAFVLLGSVLVALFPGTTEAMGDRMTIGFLWVLLVPVAVLVMAATVIGIPLALMLLALYAMSLYAAPVVPALWLGHEIVRGRGRLTRGDVALAFAAGGLVVAVAIALPWIGFLARAVATCLGLGAVVLWLRERGRAPEGGQP
jgi:hypothetical protein